MAVASTTTFANIKVYFVPSYSHILMLIIKSPQFFRAMSYSANILKGLKNPELLKTEGFINGEWTNGQSNDTFVVNNPALGLGEHAKVASVPSMTAKDYEVAIQAANTCFDTFKNTTGRYRAGLLHKLYTLVMENKEDLAKIIVLENGKPYADALGEIVYSASFFQWFAEEAPRVGGDFMPSQNESARILTIKQPIGVCGILTPWNFPAAMIARKLGAATAAGCTSVIKPASETPLLALLMAYLAERAGFPKGSVNVLPSKRSGPIGKLICEHPMIKKVSFTGSTQVGRILMEQSASTLKKLSFELGGNAPFIVFEDADLDKAILGAMGSKFRSSGQTCVCANRIFVHELLYDEFAEKFVAKVKETVMGNGMEEGVTHGPVIHQKSAEKVRDHIEDACSKGAKILVGGRQRKDLGDLFHELTVLGDVTPAMDIFHEETFGPVAPLIKFRTFDEVIAMANDTEVGLAGYFFSRDVNTVFKAGFALNVGMIGVNTGAISEAALPFGGVNQSGFGREGSKYGIDDYVVIKSMVLGGLD